MTSENEVTFTHRLENPTVQKLLTLQIKSPVQMWIVAGSAFEPRLGAVIVSIKSGGVWDEVDGGHHLSVHVPTLPKSSVEVCWSAALAFRLSA